MKPLDKFGQNYFKKYKTTPVKVKPFNPKAKSISEKHIINLKELLKKYDPIIILRGSTLFEISGKGDIEIGIYPHENDWVKILTKLTEKYGFPKNKEKNYTRFNLVEDGFEIEIIVLKGYEAKLDKAITRYLKGNRNLLKEYEDIKKKYSYSKRQYQIQKNKFFQKVSKLIPENY